MDVVYRSLMQNGEWQQFANCASADPALFTSENLRATDMERIKRICGVCVVKGECLIYALDGDDRNYYPRAGFSPSTLDRMHKIDIINRED